MYKRGTPEKYLLYKHALTLHKLINSNDHNIEFVALNLNVIFTSRQTNFLTRKENKIRFGLNALANRFFILNNEIPLTQFNSSLDTFKIFCKSKFLCG